MSLAYLGKNKSRKTDVEADWSADNNKRKHYHGCR